ncbi:MULTISPECIES: DUF427 domain-containing protein [Mumia]|uniref:DUF427 domain-containing protein n=1 Tax=Mumia TaxID=1546255 RepID=UPI00141F3383|nr:MULTISPECIES: DUF427 domain-containing protein [unclassified Mumia]QMW68408.1 DUF427 domain-containing protein [Mumia sp. ZJ1417]
MPWEDVRRDRLVPSDRTSVCAFKGTASYWSYEGSGSRHRNIAWTYRDPRHDVLPVAGMLAFFGERVDRVVDGEPQERPVTPWS